MSGQAVAVMATMPLASSTKRAVLGRGRVLPDDADVVGEPLGRATGP